MHWWISNSRHGEVKTHTFPSFRVSRVGGGGRELARIRRGFADSLILSPAILKSFRGCVVKAGDASFLSGFEVASQECDGPRVDHGRLGNYFFVLQKDSIII